MGVSIHTKDGTKGVDMPYSSLQEFRVMILLAYIEWLKFILRDQYDDDTPYDETEYEQVEELELEDEAAAEYLKKKIQIKELIELLSVDMIEEKKPARASSEPRINYKKFEKLPEHLRYEVLGAIGLYKFIDHSDADGYHSFGDAYDIRDMLRDIYLHFNDLPVTHPHYNGEWFKLYKQYLKELMDVFNEAIMNETYVEYS